MATAAARLRPFLTRSFSFAALLRNEAHNSAEAASVAAPKKPEKPKKEKRPPPPLPPRRELPIMPWNHPNLLPKDKRYFVQRSAEDKLPVFTVPRDDGIQEVHIRGIDGQGHLLAAELRISIFRCADPKKARCKVKVQDKENVIMTGKVNEKEIIDWLERKGF